MHACTHYSSDIFIFNLSSNMWLSSNIWTELVTMAFQLTLWHLPLEAFQTQGCSNWTPGFLNQVASSIAFPIFRKGRTSVKMRAFSVCDFRYQASSCPTVRERLCREVGGASDDCSSCSGLSSISMQCQAKGNPNSSQEGRPESGDSNFWDLCPCFSLLAVSLDKLSNLLVPENSRL